VISSAEIFAAALLPHHSSAPTPSASTPPHPSLSEANGVHFSTNQPLEQKPRLIIRKDLLDDSNAAKDLMDDVKKRLKILLRPGEPDKRPDLTWPKSLKKEPVEVVREVIQLLSSFRDIMRRNFRTMDVDKIQPRWCAVSRFNVQYH
jgi:inositol-hexakisphosphate/diphosphoinositol-pentakisphosphate 1-kinase